MNNQRLLRIALGVIIFGVVMSMRELVPGIWLRALIAAIAGGIFGYMLILAQNIPVTRR